MSDAVTEELQRCRRLGRAILRAAGWSEERINEWVDDQFSSEMVLHHRPEIWVAEALIPDNVRLRLSQDELNRVYLEVLKLIDEYETPFLSDDSVAGFRERLERALAGR